MYSKSIALIITLTSYACFMAFYACGVIIQQQHVLASFGGGK